MSATTILEVTMLLCFGFAWPLASLRMLRTRRCEGRGFVPTGLIFCGYLAGMAAKLFACGEAGALAPIFWMYFVNALSVGINLALQWHFGRGSGHLEVPAGLRASEQCAMSGTERRKHRP